MSILLNRIQAFTCSVMVLFINFTLCFGELNFDFNVNKKHHHHGMGVSNHVIMAGIIGGLVTALYGKMNQLKDENTKLQIRAHLTNYQTNPQSYPQAPSFSVFPTPQAPSLLQSLSQSLFPNREDQSVAASYQYPTYAMPMMSMSNPMQTMYMPMPMMSMPRPKMPMPRPKMSMPTAKMSKPMSMMFMPQFLYPFMPRYSPMMGLHGLSPLMNNNQFHSQFFMPQFGNGYNDNFASQSFMNPFSSFSGNDLSTSESFHTDLFAAESFGNGLFTARRADTNLLTSEIIKNNILPEEIIEGSESEETIIIPFNPVENLNFIQPITPHFMHRGSVMQSRLHSINNTNTIKSSAQTTDQLKNNEVLTSTILESSTLQNQTTEDNIENISTQDAITAENGG